MSEIRDAIDAADGYLVMVSPDLARSKVFSEELEHALDGGKRVVPVMVRATDQESMSTVISRLNWVDGTDGDVENHLPADRRSHRNRPRSREGPHAIARPCL